MAGTLDENHWRVLPPKPYDSLAEYVEAGGGAGLAAAGAVEPITIIEELAASGLRGRGGAGFPTGEKWRTIKSFASPVLRTSVVVNAAEGEPGTFKDRTIIRANPYAVLEGALIAARVMESTSVTIATKAEFNVEVARLRGAVKEARAAGWLGDIEVVIVEGPSEYLYGEETALLEVIDGRPPFPRIAPPFRRGVVEVVAGDADVDSGSGLVADVRLAGTDDNVAPPVLVDNVETMANIPGIVAKGAAWFRSVGTPESPGTIVCTITGDVEHPGVAELPMGTPLRVAIDTAAGGLLRGLELGAVLVGVSSGVLTADQLDTELSYESMKAIGSGLGSAGYIAIGAATDPVAIAAGVSRFLAIESCGQCTPCKTDGAEIAARLANAAAGNATEDDLIEIRALLGTVADGARCSLASQQQAVVGSILQRFEPQVTERFQAGGEPVPVHLVVPLVDIADKGEVVDVRFADKQPDWTFDAIDSGKTPVDRLTDHRSSETLEGAG
jgi:NADH-quinone oxidoreductase subunit F